MLTSTARSSTIYTWLILLHNTHHAPTITTTPNINYNNLSAVAHPVQLHHATTTNVHASPTIPIPTHPTHRMCPMLTNLPSRINTHHTYSTLVSHTHSVPTTAHRHRQRTSRRAHTRSTLHSNTPTRPNSKHTQPSTIASPHQYQARSQHTSRSRDDTHPHTHHTVRQGPSRYPTSPPVQTHEHDDTQPCSHHHDPPQHTHHHTAAPVDAPGWASSSPCTQLPQSSRPHDG